MCLSIWVGHNIRRAWNSFSLCLMEYWLLRWNPTNCSDCRNEHSRDPGVCVTHTYTESHTHSLTHSNTYTDIYTCPCSLTCSRTLTLAHTHTRTHSFTFIYSLSHSHAYALTILHTCIYSCSHIHSFTLVYTSLYPYVVVVLVAKLCLTVTHWSPLSMEFSRQEYWSGLPFPSPGDLPDPGIKPMSPAWPADFLPLNYQGRLYTLTH